jgi:hypothetical protein
MISITEIKPVDRTPYKDVIWRGKERIEVNAPVLQNYEITLCGDHGEIRRFDAEVRQTPQGEQVNWYEELDDFLFSIMSVDYANQVREMICKSIYAWREGRTLEFPIRIEPVTDQSQRKPFCV